MVLESKCTNVFLTFIHEKAFCVNKSAMQECLALLLLIVMAYISDKNENKRKFYGYPKVRKGLLFAQRTPENAQRTFLLRKEVSSSQSIVYYVLKCFKKTNNDMVY